MRRIQKNCHVHWIICLVLIEINKISTVFYFDIYKYTLTLTNQQHLSKRETSFHLLNNQTLSSVKANSSRLIIHLLLSTIYMHCFMTKAYGISK